MSKNFIEDRAGAPGETSPLDDWLDYIQSVHHRSIDMGLKRVSEVYRRLVQGKSAYFQVHIGGTNGKGSSAAMLGSILQAAGYSVGVYSSPHLVRFTERFCIDGSEVIPELVAKALARVDVARGEIPLTYFEFATLAAHSIFSSEHVDIAVMEVGMGGRFDAVNIEAPLATLITNISLDHTNWLGETRDEIAREKAGLIHAGVPVVVGDYEPPSILEKIAKEKSAEALVIGREFGFQHEDGIEEWFWWGVERGESSTMDGLPLPMGGGEEQLQNAACVLQVVRRLGPVLTVTKANCITGLANASLPGRAQLVSREPHIVLDVAHNPAAIRRLAKTIRGFGLKGRVHGIFSMLEDKDIEACVQEMIDVIDAWYVIPVAGERGMDADTLAQRLVAVLAEERDQVVVKAMESSAQALDQLTAEVGVQDCLVVFGSFYIVGDIIPRFRNHLNYSVNGIQEEKNQF